MATVTPLVLFGAFDRHNLGDLLLAEVAAWRALPRPSLFAGLCAADMRRYDSVVVRPIAEIAAGWPAVHGDAPMEVLHVGGEVLDTDAWEAATMLLPVEMAAERVATLDGRPRARMAWAASSLGTRRRVPYVVAPGFVAVAATSFRAVGGVGLARRPAAYRRELVDALRQASAVSVRDDTTRRALYALGIDAALEPDPVAGAGEWLRRRVDAVPRNQGAYLAVQCAATFADESSLAAMAAALDALGLPVCLFAAGLAPWHDDPAVLRRLANRLRVPARVVGHGCIGEICALIAGARGCIASSLHALLVTGAFGVPALGIEARPGEGRKLRAYAGTWGGFRVSTLVPFSASLVTDFRSQIGL